MASAWDLLLNKTSGLKPWISLSRKSFLKNDQDHLARPQPLARKRVIRGDRQKLLIDRLHGLEGAGNRRARESFQQYRIPFTVRLNAFSRSLIDSSRTTSSGDKIRLFDPRSAVSGRNHLAGCGAVLRIDSTANTG